MKDRAMAPTGSRDKADGERSAEEALLGTSPAVP